MSGDHTLSQKIMTLDQEKAGLEGRVQELELEATEQDEQFKAELKRAELKSIQMQRQNSRREVEQREDYEERLQQMKRNYDMTIANNKLDWQILN